MDQEIDKQDNEPLSPDGLVDILEDLYLLLHPHQTARNPFSLYQKFGRVGELLQTDSNQSLLNSAAIHCQPSIL